MAKRWNFTGDMNLEHGGLFWREDGADDYVLAVKVTPCSDAGGPDNLFHVESGSIYLPTEPARRRAALDCLGHGLTDRGLVTDRAGNVYKPRYGRAVLVEAFDAYHGLDGPDQFAVRIGKPEETRRHDGWNPEPDYVLRSDARLDRFIRREFLSRR